MEQAEMVALIRGGVKHPGGTWADLGAGTGNFTRALADLLGPQATIYAVDRSTSALMRLRDTPFPTTLMPLQGDFTRTMRLPLLDGILMANSLHFVQEQVDILYAIKRYLAPGGRLIMVEYDLRQPVPWVPYPLPFERFQNLASDAGWNTPALVGRRRSPTSGVDMYAAMTMPLDQEPGS